jgi:hypothetical protein
MESPNNLQPKGSTKQQLQQETNKVFKTIIWYSHNQTSYWTKVQYHSYRIGNRTRTWYRKN